MNIPTVLSPNRRPRRAGQSPRLIVLHSTGGSYGSALSWLTSKKSKVSAHYVNSRSGATVKLVPLSECAYHAGISSWKGEQVGKSVNDFSIGIEQEHLDGAQDWPAAQVQATARLCAELCRAYHIPIQNIVGHRDVAPGRKVDPAAFPWEEFRQYLKTLLA